MKEMKLDRKEYEKIRKMDHGQMQEYFLKTYLQGVDEGKRQAVKSTEDIDIDTLMQQIQTIKGIGGVKARKVADIVLDFLNNH